MYFGEQFKVSELIKLREKNISTNNNHSNPVLLQLQEVFERYNKFSFSCKLKDLTYLKTYTIDDSDTFEIDDAISLEIIDGKYKIWIHISSPANYISLNSAIDLEARSKASSLYLSYNVLSMLPYELVTSVLSIEPRKNISAISVCLELDDLGNLVTSEIVKSIIKSDFRLTYEEADELIDLAPKEDLNLYILSELLKHRRNWRKNNGAIINLKNDSKIKIRDDKLELSIIENSPSRLLIEEAMIIMGHIIGNFCLSNKIPIPFRCQDKSNVPDFNKQQNEVLNNLNIKKSLNKSYISIKAKQHFSLGLDCYTQFTSPIRRYIDLLAHYQISSFIDGSSLINEHDMSDLIRKYLTNQSQAYNIMVEDKRYWQKVFIYLQEGKLIKALFIRWIKKSSNIALIHFLDFGFNYIIEIISSNDLLLGKEILLKKSSRSTIEINDDSTNLQMLVI